MFTNLEPIFRDTIKGTETIKKFLRPQINNH